MRNTLDHCYSNYHDAYKALPRPLFSNSDHDAILFLPSYRQKLKKDVPVTRTIQRWSDQSEATQDCYDHADWNMFRSASENNIDLYTDLVSVFIKKCIGDIVLTIKTYANQKLWMDGGIHTKLKARSTAFNHGKEV